MLAALLVLMMLSSSLAAQRKSLDEIHRQAQRLRAEKGVKGEGGKESSSVNNHHTIPRQNYNNWSGGSDGDGSGDGTG